MNIARTTLQIGLPQPIRLLHCSDTHIARVDDQDSGRTRREAGKRAPIYHHAEQYFQAMLERLPGFDLLVHTGDLIDFVSHANLEYIQTHMSGVNWIFAAGNHELCNYTGEELDADAYRQKYFGLLQEAFPNPLRFASRIFGGVNFVAVDNCNYQFRESALEAFRCEAAKGYPILLLIHNPIHTDDLFTQMMDVRRTQCAYLAGTPEQLLQRYPTDYRQMQRPTPTTLAFIREIKQCRHLKAILSGHLHANYETNLHSTLPQYVAGGAFQGDMRELKIY